MLHTARMICVALVLGTALGGGARAQVAPPLAPRWNIFSARRSANPLEPDDSSGFMRLEYLNWSINDAPLPAPLITTGDNSGLGRIGEPGTTVLAGAAPQPLGNFSGGRVRVLKWIDSEETYGADISGFAFEHRLTHLQVAGASGSNPLVTIPFLDTSSGTPRESSLLIAQPGVASGSAAVFNGSQLLGFDCNLAGNLSDFLPSPSGNFRILGGFAVLGVNEQLQLVTNSATTSGGLFHTSDIFRANNTFIGLEIGAVRGRRFGPFFVELNGKFAIGANPATLTIAAQDNLSNSRLVPDKFTHDGIFAQPTNIGRYWGTYFSVLPQLQLRTSYDLGHGLRATLGYDALLMTGVLRPGNMLDRHLNMTQIKGPFSGPLQPTVQLHPSLLFAHGLSAGLELAY